MSTQQAAASCAQVQKEGTVVCSSSSLRIVPSTFEDKVQFIDYSTWKAFKRIRKQKCTFSTRNENVNRNKDDSRQTHLGQTEKDTIAKINKIN